MREILFRAKRKDNGEWAEGYLFDDGMAEVEHYFVGRIVVEPYKGTACDDWDITGIDFCEVNPETLCQYTGLKDKNGKKIWENDIIRVENSANEGTGVVVFYEGVWYVNRGVNNSLYNIVLYDDEAEIYIIGNIIDNPYMVKKG